MTRDDLIQEIRNLPLEQQIALVAEVWDDIAASAEEVPTPEWHLRELDKRLADPDPRYVPWGEVRERLNADEAP